MRVIHSLSIPPTHASGQREFFPARRACDSNGALPVRNAQRLTTGDATDDTRIVWLGFLRRDRLGLRLAIGLARPLTNPRENTMPELTTPSRRQNGQNPAFGWPGKILFKDVLDGEAAKCADAIDDVLKIRLSTRLFEQPRHLLRGSQKGKYLDLAQECRAGIDGMWGHYPPWVQGRMRAMLASLHVG